MAAAAPAYVWCIPINSRRFNICALQYYCYWCLLHSLFTKNKCLQADNFCSRDFVRLNFMV